MYIKLNTIRIQYLKEVNDNYIISEVPDSTMSYENPIIVRTVDELNSWFGNNFSSYNYFIELISQGVSLYIYKPVNTKSIKTDDYIDINNYSIDPGIYPTKEYLEETVLNPDPNTKYRVGTIYIDWDSLNPDSIERTEFPDNPEPNTKYLINGVWYTYIDGTWYSENDIPGEYYIYVDAWVSEHDLPQNTEKTSISQENRDVLLISKPSNSDNPDLGYNGTITHCYPEYHESKLGIYSDPSDEVVEIDQTYPITIEDTTLKSSYVFDIDIIDPSSFSMESYYLILYSTWLIPEIDWEELNRWPDELEEFPEIYVENTKYKINGVFWTWDPINEVWVSENDIPKNPVRYLFYKGDWSYLIPESYIPSVRRVEISDEMELLEYLRDHLDYLFEYILVETLPTNLTPGKKCFYKDETGYVRLYTRIIGGWDSEDSVISMYSPIPLLFEDSYNIPGLSLSLNEKKSQIQLTKNLNESDWGIEVWSKTIGRSDPKYETDLIELQIDHISDNEIYQITVSRFGYSEVYEGTINPKTGEEERLDYRVSRESNLVYIRFDNIVNGLRTGKWVLQGAIAEEYNPTMYWKALELMFNSDSVVPDYLLIPDKSFWTSNITNPNYLIKFLDYAKAFSFQVLIQNNGSKYSILEVNEIPEWNKDIPDYILFKRKSETYNSSSTYWYNNGEDIVEFTNTTDIEIAENKGDYIYNYTGDKDNRLIYFFLGMTIQRRYRPAYYMYLLGWLSDIYSMSAKYIYYSSFVTNPYIDEDLEKQLINYKSNYLVCNNQLYYYKGYQNGETYESTGWMRFAVSRITRDLQRFKWKYLAKRTEVRILEGITQVLNDIVTRFSIIGKISILNLQIDRTNNKIYLQIETQVKDLINNNISLDITINYKED